MYPPTPQAPTGNGRYTYSYPVVPQQVPAWPGYPPPPWPMPRQAPSPRRRSRWPIAVTAIVVVVLTAGSSVLWWQHGRGESSTAAASSEQAPQTQAPVPRSAMDDLLVTPAQAEDIFGTGPMGGREGRPDEIFTSMIPPTEVVDDSCNVGTPGRSENHDDSDYQTVRRRYLTSQDRDENQSLVQAVVRYADAPTAQRFVDEAKTAWERCANRSVDLTAVGEPGAENQYWSTGDVTEDDGMILMTFFREENAEWTCEDAMVARNNIVIELEFCGTDPEWPVDEVADVITENIDSA